MFNEVMCIRFRRVVITSFKSFTPLLCVSFLPMLSFTYVDPIVLPISLVVKQSRKNLFFCFSFVC